ncbi:MAG: long-chain-fatty-acid--CoA ligase [Pseudomonadales bacterium]|nr:long-chain fatty acid--CoA ligase [Pseudomonadales bacterium]NIX07874.1 long-chain-fatty-acid--CoA ligase [Pseudomonadales bacterium]
MSSSTTRLTQGIHRALDLYAPRPALVSSEGTISWQAFGDRVARLAGALKELGIGPGDRVAMLALNSARYVEYYFGVIWAGGVLAPVNCRWAEPEKAHCLTDSGAKVLLADADHLEEALALAATCGSVLHVIAMGAAAERATGGALDYEALVSESAPVEDAQRGGTDLAALFYTGGTTGRAKGVMLSHENFIANSMTALVNLGISEDSVHLHVAPLFHLAGGSRLFTVTVAGGTHAVIPRFEAGEFLGAIERFGVTVTVIVPTMLNTLLQHPNFEAFDLTSLDLLCYGASPMPESLLREAMERLPGVRFLQSYGMTELSPVATMLEPKFHTFEGPLAGKIRSAGRAVFNADVAIMGPDDGPLPRGEVGEICVRGPMVMQGYWGQPALTAEALRGGWMHTGDAGYLDEDGFLFLVDRVKDMIITGGENVYSAAVENVLYLHPDVHECAVIGVPSDAWGEAVHAIVVPGPGAELDEAAVIEHCRAHLAGYECPKTVEFVAGELPKSGAGKILKAELRRSHWQGQARNIH